MGFIYSEYYGQTTANSAATLACALPRSHPVTRCPVWLFALTCTRAFCDTAVAPSSLDAKGGRYDTAARRCEGVGCGEQRRGDHHRHKLGNRQASLLHCRRPCTAARTPVRRRCWLDGSSDRARHCIRDGDRDRRRLWGDHLAPERRIR